MASIVRSSSSDAMKILGFLTCLAIVMASSDAFTATIHGCVHQNSGVLRVVGPGDACRGNETELDWSQEGPEGIPGADGLPGLSGYEIVTLTENDVLEPHGDAERIAQCPEGKKVLGGGYVVPSVLDTAPLSRPEGDSAWMVSFHSNGGSGAVTVYAICAFVEE